VHDAGPDEPAYDFWQVPILKTVATENQGLEELAGAVERHRIYLDQSGLLIERQRAAIEAELAARLREALLARLVHERTPAAVEETVERILARDLDPGSAVRALLDGAA